jgi:hypothetical protein
MSGASKHKNSTLMSNENYLAGTYFAMTYGCARLRW